MRQRRQLASKYKPAHSTGGSDPKYIEMFAVPCKYLTSGLAQPDISLQQQCFVPAVASPRILPGGRPLFRHHSERRLRH